MVTEVLRKTRVLKYHRTAARKVLDGWLADMKQGAEPELDALADRIAAEVLTAYDHLGRWAVVTSDFTAYGPYATYAAARKAVDSGVCAFREGTQAMVLPLQVSPRKAREPRHPDDPPEGVEVVAGQLTLDLDYEG